MLGDFGFDMKSLAIIPARAGSKRLPKKNILDLAGKPLIAWTIEAAIKSGCFDTVLVSTDSEELREIAIKYGAEAPFLRPLELSSDNSNSIDVIKHAIQWLRNAGLGQSEFTTLLQPTSPLRTAEDIVAAFDLLNKKNANGIVSVSEADHSPLWMNTLPNDGSLTDFIKPEVRELRSQELPKYYRLNGAIYIAKTANLLIESSFFGQGCFAYIMRHDHSIDIDTEFDFVFSDFLMREKFK
ncbi:cytidylyltransferase domain-containing protein [Chitinibacter tainanensis]|uniref:acylneuraminate cytidylyltransferase family protein n=1 Tax=Chitinibacter tainanensis TaxID=230667 RepID=UPI002355CD92|nr:acylneuraminate cytidylyltransferase family protein [Chitinibacter tainanensis]